MSGVGNSVSFSVNGNTYVVSGEVVGNTLILTRTDGQTVNIPLPAGTIDFANLTTAQRDALAEALRGNRVLDIAGVEIGYLLPV